MKNTIIILFSLIINLFFGQKPNLPLTPTCPSYNIVPLRTYTDIPEDQCYYMKDTNNELAGYVGTWVGTWNNKTIYITFKKMTNQYYAFRKYYEDILIGKFKVVNSDGSILFNNIGLTDDNAKINGGGFQKLYPNKYSMLYNDKDVCNTSGRIMIHFTDASKTQIEWQFSYNSMMISTDCQYHATGIPDVLPKGVVLTKQ
ncbi:DUF6705 family protein [Chryseobacterium sp. 3008163]|uniref:DUF6705 family protein n=1 Tax=Chryseobacterium sp. 3008163 TaxID=2478663 RepID=UPI000F0BE7B3|nr:DUF6705 family protein [Chryseobacterium sp. 3008163]AYN01919.1 hypothetical protein EAG08_17925 [Chryseobacterium sp. 3008163]